MSIYSKPFELVQPIARDYDGLQPAYVKSPFLNYEALKDLILSMRKAGEIEIGEVEITRHNITKLVYFVGPPSGMDEKIAAFRKWFDQTVVLSVEPIHFAESFAGDSCTPVAWLSLNPRLGWALELTIAKELRELLQSIRF